ncbi:MAG: hypothetical protein JOZ11_12625 [Alphaproteobacteria bacterium]|nr:hypothetical protein [Alphaproteobacteria bacterium]
MRISVGKAGEALLVRVSDRAGARGQCNQTADVMYENHPAREDTIVFPAWKDALSEHQFDQMGEEFEEIERQQFGKDGFVDAVAQIGQIEEALGYVDLARFNAPPPSIRAT